MTILILMNPEVSAYHATFPLADALIRRGNRVQFAVESFFQDYVAAHGYATIAIQLRRRANRHEANGNTRAARYRRLVSEIMEIKDLIEQVRPQIVLLDQIVWWLAIPFLKRHIPVIGLRTNLSWKCRLDTPPISSSIAPPLDPSLLLRMKCAMAWLNLLLRKRENAGNFHLSQFIRPTPGAAVEITALRRLKKCGSTASWGDYGWSLNIPELILCPAEFDFPLSRSRPSVVYAGACVRPKSNSIFPWEDRAVHSPLFDTNYLDNGKETIYCSMGSHDYLCQYKKSLFDALIRAISLKPDLQLVIQTRDKSLFPDPLPERVFFAEWVNQSDMLSKASVFITHAGLASVRESIYHGVPMVALPFWNDGFGNAARIEYHSLGLRGDIAKINPEELGSLIDKAKSLKGAASLKNMQNAFLRQTSCDAAAAFVSQYLPQSQ